MSSKTTAPKLESSATPENKCPTSPGEAGQAPGPEQKIPIPAESSRGGEAFAPAPVQGSPLDEEPPIRWQEIREAITWEMERRIPGPTVEVRGNAMTENVASLLKALARAQGDMRPALKDRENPHFKSSYADLASVWDAWRECGPRYGLAVVQLVEADESGKSVTVITTLGHTSGQWVRSQLRLPVTQANAQGIGSAITYARRYALAAIVGVAPAEDDGEAAVGRSANEVPASKPTPKNGNGNGKSYPAAEKAAAAKKEAAPADPLKPLKWEVMSLLCELVGVKKDDGTYDQAATMEAGRQFLPHANAWKLGTVPLDAKGEAELGQATEQQLALIKQWLSKELAAQSQTKPPF